MKVYSKLFPLLIICTVLALLFIVFLPSFASEEDDTEQFVIQFNTFSSKANINNAKYSIGSQVTLYKQGEQISAGNYMVRDGYTLLGWVVCMKDFGESSDNASENKAVYYKENSIAAVEIEQATLYTDSLILKEDMLVETPLGKRAFLNAVWKEDTHRVVYICDGKELNIGDAYAQTGTEIILPDRPHGYGNQGQAFMWQYGDKNYAPGTAFTIPEFQDKDKIVKFTAHLIDKQCQMEIVYALHTDSGFKYNNWPSNIGIDNCVNGIVTYTYGTPILQVLTVPAARNGFVFSGWYRDAVCTSPISENDIGEETYFKVYAKWEAMKDYKFSVNFSDGNGNEILPQMLVSYGTVISAPAPAELLAGYIFGGWQTEDMLYTDGMQITVEDHMNLVATWIPDNLSIILIFDGKTTTASSVAGALVNIGTRFKAESRFLGWYDEEDRLISEDGYFIMPDHAITLTAKFEKMQYRILFENSYTNRSTEIVLSSGEPLHFETAEAILGYTFSGWTDEEGNAVPEGTVPTSDLILKAKYDLIRYTLTYSDGGDSFSESVSYFEAENYRLTKPKSKTGYRFVSFRDADGKEIGSAVTLTGDLTVYPHFEEIFYTVELIDAISGDSQKIQVSAVSPVFTLPECTAPSGFQFDGWKNTAGDVIKGETTVSGNEIFKASFSRLEKDTPQDSDDNSFDTVKNILLTVFTFLDMIILVVIICIIVKRRKKAE